MAYYRRRKLACLRTLYFLCSLRSRRLEVVGARKNGCTRGRRAPVLSSAHYFQGPATQAIFLCRDLGARVWK